MASETPRQEEEKLPRYTNNDGYRVAGGFPVEGFRSGLKYQAQDNDLFIVTYPKVRLNRYYGVSVRLFVEQASLNLLVVCFFFIYDLV